MDAGANDASNCEAATAVIKHALPDSLASWLPDYIGRDGMTLEDLEDGFVLIQLRHQILSIIAPNAIDLGWYTTDAAMTHPNLSQYNRELFVKAASQSIPLSERERVGILDGDVQCFVSIASKMRLMSCNGGASAEIKSNVVDDSISESRDSNTPVIASSKTPWCWDFEYEPSEVAFKSSVRWLLAFVQRGCLAGQIQISLIAEEQLKRLIELVQDSTPLIPSGPVISCLTAGLKDAVLDMSIHSKIIENLISASLKSFSIEMVSAHLKERFPNHNPAYSPYDLEDALLMWANTCALQLKDEYTPHQQTPSRPRTNASAPEKSPSTPTLLPLFLESWTDLDHFCKDFRDGRAFNAIAAFYGIGEQVLDPYKVYPRRRREGGEGVETVNLSLAQRIANLSVFERACGLSGMHAPPWRPEELARAEGNISRVGSAAVKSGINHGGSNNASSTTAFRYCLQVLPVRVQKKRALKVSRKHLKEVAVSSSGSSRPDTALLAVAAEHTSTVAIASRPMIEKESKALVAVLETNPTNAEISENSQNKDMKVTPTADIQLENHAQFDPEHSSVSTSGHDFTDEPMTDEILESESQLIPVVELDPDEGEKPIQHDVVTSSKSHAAMMLLFDEIENDALVVESLEPDVENDILSHDASICAEEHVGAPEEHVVTGCLEASATEISFTDPVDHSQIDIPVNSLDESECIKLVDFLKFEGPGWTEQTADTLRSQSKLTKSSPKTEEVDQQSHLSITAHGGQPNENPLASPRMVRAHSPQPQSNDSPSAFLSLPQSKPTRLKISSTPPNQLPAVFKAPRTRKTTHASEKHAQSTSPKAPIVKSEVSKEGGSTPAEDSLDLSGESPRSPETPESGVTVAIPPTTETAVDPVQETGYSTTNIVIDNPNDAIDASVDSTNLSPIINEVADVGPSSDAVPKRNKQPESFEAPRNTHLSSDFILERKRESKFDFSQLDEDLDEQVDDVVRDGTASPDSAPEFDVGNALGEDDDDDDALQGVVGAEKEEGNGIQDLHAFGGFLLDRKQDVTFAFSKEVEEQEEEWDIEGKPISAPEFSIEEDLLEDPEIEARGQLQEEVEENSCYDSSGYEDESDTETQDPAGDARVANGLRTRPSKRSIKIPNASRKPVRRSVRVHTTANTLATQDAVENNSPALQNVAPSAEPQQDARIKPASSSSRVSTGLMTFPIPETSETETNKPPNENCTAATTLREQEEAWERSKLAICRLKQKKSKARGLETSVCESLPAPPRLVKVAVLPPLAVPGRHDAKREKLQRVEEARLRSAEMQRAKEMQQHELRRQKEQQQIDLVTTRSLLRAAQRASEKEMALAAQRAHSTISHASLSSSSSLKLPSITPGKVSVTAAARPPSTRKPTRAAVVQTQSNRKIIKNALQVCLAGTVNERVKAEVLEDLDSSPAHHFIILFRGLKNHAFKGLYSYDPSLRQVLRVYAPASSAGLSKPSSREFPSTPPAAVNANMIAGPNSIAEEDVLEFYKYDSGARAFKVVPTRSFGCSVHAVAVRTSLATMQFVDCHAHFYPPNYTPEDIASHLTDPELLAIVVTPETAAESLIVLAQSELHPQLKPCIGLHPVQHVTNSEGEVVSVSAHPSQLEQVDRMIRENKDCIVAVGEIGLDFSPWILEASAKKPNKAWNCSVDDVKQLQRSVFSSQLATAKSLNLPVNCHSRNAGHHAIALLEQHGMLPQSLLHAFDGAPKHAVKAAQAGALFSVPGSIIRDDSMKRLVEKVPLASLCLESDAPALAPVKGGAAWPGESVRIACACMAEVKGVSGEEVARTTTENARRLFRL
ncbi:putative deoxyribonuclease tatdn3 [Podochytrium sp. JEL0797]|nr:putative deoxyribonuclease tatdn3 [Podochytrium sp. JEL0797]